MKKVFALILVIAVLAVLVFSAQGEKVVKIQPIQYIQAVQEDLPERPEILSMFLDFYEPGEESFIEHLFKWNIVNGVALGTFPLAMLFYSVDFCACIVSNYDTLVVYESELAEEVQ